MAKLTVTAVRTSDAPVLNTNKLTWREFRHDSKGKSAPQVWLIAQDGERYFTQHGLLGGAIQEFSDVPGDKGKPDTKAYVSAVDNCLFHIEREIRKKTEHGYIEYINGKAVSEQVNSIDFSKHLPKNFCGYKPQTSIEDKTLEKIHKTGKGRYTRKYDGMCHLMVHHTWGWEVYTRRMDLATEKFPNHLAQLLEIPDFGVGTILQGELVCSKPDGKDDFKAISRFCRSLINEARQLVTDKEIPEPKFIIFDMLFHNGKDLKDTCYDQRSKLWNPVPFKRIAISSNHVDLIKPVDYFKLTPENWQKIAKDNGWEGFVFTDGDSVPGEKFYSFDGDAKRPKGHHKLKPCYEDDVVIYAAVKGSGKRLDGIGAVFVKQRHPETKEWFACGKVGSGFTEEDLEDLEKECKKHNVPILEKDKDVEKIDINNTNGIVSMIEYGERQPGTQKFRFPVFIRTRDDKLAKECFAQRLAADEE